MMTRPFVPLLLAVVPFAAPAAAVNLVPNPSFETYTSCPSGFAQPYLATPWTAPTTGTSDWFHVCATSNFVSVPVSVFGYQQPATGDAYGALIPYSAAPDYREYLEVPLNSPLIAGATYTMSFKVSVGDICNLVVDRIGAYFSVGAVGPVGNDLPLPFVPQIENPAGNFLADTLNWMTISGSFVAAGGENFLTIGNFRDDASTGTQPGPGNWPGGSYYFVDDVVVEQAAPETDQACCLAGQCTLLTPTECSNLGGTPLGTGTVCVPDPCGPTSKRVRSWGALKTIYR